MSPFALALLLIALANVTAFTRPLLSSRVAAKLSSSTASPLSALKMSFESKYFKKDAVSFSGTTEYIVKGATEVRAHRHRIPPPSNPL